MHMFFILWRRWSGKKINSVKGECRVLMKSFRVPFWARVPEVWQPWTSSSGDVRRQPYSVRLQG